MNKLSELFSLIRNEWTKIFKRGGTYVMIAVLVLVILLMAFITNWVNSQQDQDVSWETEIHEQMEGYRAQAANPEATADEKAYYNERLMIAEHHLKKQVPPLERDSFGQYLLDSSSSLSFTTLFTVILAAGIVASEFTWGTIKLLTIRPASRVKILSSKYIAAVLFAIAITAITYLANVLAGILFFDSGNGVLYGVSDGQVVEKSIWVDSLGRYGLAFVHLFIMTSLAFMIGTVFRSNSLAIGLSIFLMFTGQQFVFLLREYDFIKYYLFTHTDLTQYLQPSPMVEGITMPFSIFILAIYLVLFLAVSFFSFTKRDIAG